MWQDIVLFVFFCDVLWLVCFGGEKRVQSRSETRQPITIKIIWSLMTNIEAVWTAKLNPMWMFFHNKLSFCYTLSIFFLFTVYILDTFCSMNNNLQISEWHVKDNYSQPLHHLQLHCWNRTTFYRMAISKYFGVMKGDAWEKYDACVTFKKHLFFFPAYTPFLYISAGSWRFDTRTIAMLMRQGVCAKVPL